MSPHNHYIPSLALIGVTGYGSIYWKYVRELLAAGSVRLVAAVVINPDEARDALAEMKRQETRVYSCYQEMLAAEAGQVDLCLIPTGIAWHARMTVAALDGGMNVLVEKPLAGSLADVRAIREAEERSGRWVAVGFQDMYCPEVVWLKKILCQGGIGRIRRVQMVGLWPRAESYFARNHWAGKLEADGAQVLDSPLNNAFAHFVNLVFFLTGKEIQTSADVEPKSANLWRAHAIDTFDTGWVVAGSFSGTRFEFFVSHACPLTREPEIRIEGSEGVAEWHHEGPVAFLPHEGEAVIRPLPTIAEARRAMFDAALNRLVNPDAFICTTEMAEKHTGFIDALHRLASIREIHPDEIDWTLVRSGPDRLPIVRGIDDPFRLVANGEGGKGLLRHPGLFEAVSKFHPVCVEPRSETPFPMKS
jgi:predicted dehydrogenase